MTGIYEIVSPSGSRYIGSAVDFGARWRVHLHHLRRGTHHNNGLGRAAKKYDIENLKFSVLLRCRREDLVFFEQRAINALRPKYNACPTAGSQLGRKHSAESIAKIAAAHRGKRQSKEQRLQTSLRLRGNKYGAGKKKTPEQLRKLSASLTGKRHADSFAKTVTKEQLDEIVAKYEMGENLLALAARFGTDHRCMRRVMTERGVVIRVRGNPLRRSPSPETRAKISASLRASQ